MGRARAWVDEGARRGARSLALVFAVLALILQANAPVQAAMMAAGSDLPANLCVSHTPGQDHKAPADRDAACAACAVCIAGATTAVLSGTTSFFPPVSTAFIPSATRRFTPIRGPPARAANARAPPVIA
jgi:hypothetical protein